MFLKKKDACWNYMMFLVWKEQLDSFIDLGSALGKWPTLSSFYPAGPVTRRQNEEEVPLSETSSKPHVWD